MKDLRDIVREIRDFRTGCASDRIQLDLWADGIEQAASTDCDHCPVYTPSDGLPGYYYMKRRAR